MYGQQFSLYRKDNEPLYHAFFYCLQGNTSQLTIVVFYIKLILPTLYLKTIKLVNKKIGNSLIYTTYMTILNHYLPYPALISLLVFSK